MQPSETRRGKRCQVKIHTSVYPNLPGRPTWEESPGTCQMHLAILLTHPPNTRAIPAGYEKNSINSYEEHMQYDLERKEGKLEQQQQVFTYYWTLSGPITSWEIDGETVETVSDFILGGSKITADDDCSHEIKRCLLLGRKVMTNLDSIFKSRDITLPTKVCLVKAMVFPVVMYGCESRTVKKAEH